MAKPSPRTVELDREFLRREAIQAVWTFFRPVAVVFDFLRRSSDPDGVMRYDRDQRAPPAQVR